MENSSNVLTPLARFAAPFIGGATGWMVAGPEGIATGLIVGRLANACGIEEGDWTTAEIGTAALEAGITGQVTQWIRNRITTASAGTSRAPFYHRILRRGLESVRGQVLLECSDERHKEYAEWFDRSLRRLRDGDIPGDARPADVAILIQEGTEPIDIGWPLMAAVLARLGTDDKAVLQLNEYSLCPELEQLLLTHLPSQMSSAMKEEMAVAPDDLIDVF